MRTSHNIRTGVYRLHNAPKDVYTRMSYSDAIVEFDKVGQQYKELYDDYNKDMQSTLENASAQWEAKLDTLIQTGLSEPDAIAALIKKRVAGPADHPMVTWVVRKYWLACDALNRESTSGGWVPPETFVVKWPYDQGRDNFIELLSALPYWPIGLDENGNWC